MIIDYTCVYNMAPYVLPVLLSVVGQGDMYPSMIIDHTCVYNLAPYVLPVLLSVV